ncbi:MAG TPA: SDR family NAD(P)-dependent oxidoreductase [Candidatus Acidoferrum sp.]|nr:SDR family NAD(P)-dependent oxidoreductase [Candidatus Acidoferrum sp.]
MANISTANSGADAEKPLAGGVALVTGGGRGIGKAIAQRLAKLGAAVSICGRNEESLMSTAQELRALGVRVHAHGSHPPLFFGAQRNAPNRATPRTVAT